MKNPKLLPPLLIILLCALTRIPQLISPNLLLDGDECILALMAKHLYEGKEIALYFYGQQYGLSILETSVIALFYTLFGITHIAVKLAMLTIFTGAVVLFYYSLKNISRNWQIALFLSLLFILTPAWAVWSMKARGGYLTAFLFSSLALYLATHPRLSYKTYAWAVIAFLLVLIFESQPVFLVATLPLVLYLAWRKLSRGQIAIFITAAVIATVLFRILHLGLSHFYKPTPFALDAPLLSNIATLPQYIYQHLTGFYYLDHPFPPPLPVKLFAILFFCVLAGTLLAAIYFLLKRRSGYSVFLAALCGILLMLGYSALRSGDSYRYLLPLTGVLLFAIASLPGLPVRTAFRASSIFLSLLGLVSLVCFYNYTFHPTSKKQLDAAISHLKQNDIGFCYSGPLLQWQLMFYSREGLICRFIFPTDRYPPYATRTDSAFNASTRHVAFINTAEAMSNLSPADSCTIYQGYAIRLHPSKYMLKQNGYIFP